MNLMEFEGAIQEMRAEVALAPKEGAKERVLRAWRAKLGAEPACVPAFRIDEIVREVRRREARQQKLNGTQSTD